jgi:type I restriction enzyme R subunit
LTGEDDGEDEETVEDKINAIMEQRKMLPNASYFAFTATPKNKTLEIFGEPFTEGDTIKHRPFHSYTMKQAIQEGFILDVLRYYTPVNSYYRLVKTVDADPEFDTKRATKKLRRYVESNDHAIRLKAEIMIDHFHEQVLALNKIGGQARAMVVTSGIEQAIQYFQAISAYLVERKSPYRAIVAFSGEGGPPGETARVLGIRQVAQVIALPADLRRQRHRHRAGGAELRKTDRSVAVAFGAGEAAPGGRFAGAMEGDINQRRELQN